MFRRARFIWTARQAVDLGALARIFLVGPTPRDDGRNRWFLFRRCVHLPAPATDASLSITVDGRYQLFVNGSRVGRGPVRSSPLHQRVDTYPIARHLQPGENVIAVLVRVYGIDTSWYERVAGEWQPVFGDGGLWCEGDVRCADGTVVALDSDPSWRCLEATAWERDTPRINWGLPPIEVHDARAMPVGWTVPGFDDAGWDATQILSAGGGPPDGLLGGLEVVPFPTLVPREITFLEELTVRAERTVGWWGVVPHASLSVDRRVYDEALVALPDGAVAGSDVRTTADRDVTVLLDFGRIHTGRPFVEVEGQGGEVIDLAVAEGARGEWDAEPAHPPRITRESGHGAHVVRWVARPGRQRLETFEWSAVRWAQVTVRNAAHGLRLHDVGVTVARYPVEERGTFTSSDPVLERLWQVARDTLRCCMHDAWEDCPSREQRQWLGDVTVESLVAQAAFGPSANALTRQFLRQAAESQRPDGLTQMYAPGDHHGNGMVIPDWTLQWILCADAYLLYSGDLDTIEAIFPSIERALAWFERQTGPHELLVDLPYWHFMDWAALGRHGEAAALNAQLAGTLRAAARLAAALEHRRAARRYAARAGRIATALDARHWDARRGVYVDCVDPATGEQGARVSQHANAAALLWDVAPPARWPAVIAWVTDPARVRFTAAPPIVPAGEPVDEATDVVMANTFYAHFLYRALARAGRFDLALAMIRARYGPMLARGATTLWESFEPTASLCHGFSTTPLFQLSTEVLGVAPTAPGFARFRIAPQPVDLGFARGVFPTVRGDVRVAWERRGETIALDVSVPNDSQADLVAPPGWHLTAGIGPLEPGTHRARFVAGG